jgi:hypothetical protein
MEFKESTYQNQMPASGLPWQAWKQPQFELVSQMQSPSGSQIHHPFESRGIREDRERVYTLCRLLLA